MIHQNVTCGYRKITASESLRICGLGSIWLFFCVEEYDPIAYERRQLSSLRFQKLDNVHHRLDFRYKKRCLAATGGSLSNLFRSISVWYS